MAKLRGAKKKAFLARMAKGRRRKIRAATKVKKPRVAARVVAPAVPAAPAVKKAKRHKAKASSKSKSASHKSTRKSTRKKARKSTAHRAPTMKVKRSTSMKLPRKARKVYVIAAEKTRKSRKSRKPRAAYRRKGALENPLSATELFIGSLVGLVGFGTGDFVDRLIATHGLVDTGKKNAAGLEVYGDNPPTTGSYAGLFNATAICAPMNITRWVNALGVPAVGFVTAHFVKSPVLRSSTQFFAFGYMVRTVGKGALDALAMLTRPTQLGQRLYDGEMRAMALAGNGGDNQAQAIKDLPAAGFGRPAQLGVGCNGNCGCTKCQSQGVGYPSMPREIEATATTQARPPVTTPPAATPPHPAINFTVPHPAAPPPPPAAYRNNGLTGAPQPRTVNPYAPWGGI